jgi:hypothetical protein
MWRVFLLEQCAQLKSLLHQRYHDPNLDYFYNGFGGGEGKFCNAVDLSFYPKPHQIALQILLNFFLNL